MAVFQIISALLLTGAGILELHLWFVLRRRVNEFAEAVNEERQGMQLPVHTHPGGFPHGTTRDLQAIRADLEELLQTEQKRWQSAVSKELMAEKIRFAQLQDQINPHFLYNTLENIRARAILDDNLVIADMTETLSQYFRYNISRGEDIVPLGDELDNIRLYMKIQKYRFGDRLSFRIENHGDPDLLNKCMIPKMTLQPVVENAIFHGIEPKLSNGNVWIHTDNTAHLVELLVEDDGVGIAPDQLEKIQAQMEKEDSAMEWVPRRKGNGVAIQNVNNRLKLLYGREYGLTITSTQGVGTQVRILLPALLADNYSGAASTSSVANLAGDAKRIRSGGN